jgi:perosamine synthetase
VPNDRHPAASAIKERARPSHDRPVPLSVPCIRGNEWEYVRDCLDTEWVSSVGAYVDRFEADFAAYIGAPAATAVVNGTSAIHLGLAAVDCQPGDAVLVPDLTFVASATPVVFSGARPCFVDVDPDTGCLTPEILAQYLDAETRMRDGVSYLRTTGQRIRAAVVVHLLGNPAPIGPIVDMLRERGIAVVEDAAQALGTRWEGRHVGLFGDVGCFSFNGNKTITTGGGGMLVSRDEELVRRAGHRARQSRLPGIWYEHDELGYNYRLTNIQAAMGVAQLEDIEERLRAKRETAEFYSAELQGMQGARLLTPPPGGESSWWLCGAVLDLGSVGADIERMVAFGESRGVQTRPLFTPLHRVASMASFAADTNRQFPGAEHLAARTLLLPSSANITPEDRIRVVEMLHALHSSGHAGIR